MELALESGADDVISSDDGYEVRCEIAVFDTVIHALDEAGIKTESAEIAYIPTTTAPVDSLATAKTLEKLHESLDDNDDVQHVFSNQEFTDEVNAALEAE